MNLFITIKTAYSLLTYLIIYYILNYAIRRKGKIPRKKGGEIMREEHMDFGQFIRSKRLKDSRELTLRDISKELGISLSMLSDI